MLSIGVVFLPAALRLLGATGPAALVAPLAVADDLLSGIYWGCLILGGGLVLISALGTSGHDAHSGFEFDHASALDAAHGGALDAHSADLDTAAAHPDPGGADFHAAGHAGAATVASVLSVRFVVFFLAVFGVIGVTLTNLTSVGRGATLTAALIGGVAVGQAVHQLFRYLRRSSGDSTPMPQDYINKVARVSIGIERPQKGEVALAVRGAQRYVPAVVAGRTDRFLVGEDVVVVAYHDGIAEVVSKAEFTERSRGL